MMCESQDLMKHLNEVGLKEGDTIFMRPAVGRSNEFEVNRTHYHFVCDKADKNVDSLCKKKIVSMKNEYLHTELSLMTSSGPKKEKLKRYYIEAKGKMPIKVNGNLVFKAIIERGDQVEIGYNTLTFSKKIVDEYISEQDSFLLENQNVLNSNLSLLIQGETGTGKTSLAKKIHSTSERLGNFVHVNISSFSNNLMESELFGHEKGAFTGATFEKKGAFREAQGGTLFIDEIDSLPIELQTKLLLFLDDGTARPVGGHRSYQVDTRLIFASGSPLEKLVERKKMRKDFYFRLISGEVFDLKPLRLDPHKIRSYCETYCLKENVRILPKLIDFYMTLPWPGNYRQLRSHLERKKVISKGRKFIFDKIDERIITQSSALSELHDSIISLQEVKVAYAKKAYYRSEKNYTQAAQQLNISPKSLKSLLQGDIIT